MVRAGLLSVVEDQVIDKALLSISSVLTKMNPLLISGAVPVMGNVVNDLNPNVISRVTKAVNWLGKAAPVIGGAIDFGVQISQGESVGHALIKASINTAIGVGAAAVGVTMAAALGWAGIAGVAVGSILAGVSVKVFDDFYDDTLKDPIDSIMQDIGGAVIKSTGLFI